MTIQLTNLVITKNKPKNSNVKTFKKPKKLKNLNIPSLKIIETKHNIYIYIYIYIYVITQQRNIEKDELPLKEQFVDIVVEICQTISKFATKKKSEKSKN